MALQVKGRSQEDFAKSPDLPAPGSGTGYGNTVRSKIAAQIYLADFYP